MQKYYELQEIIAYVKNSHPPTKKRSKKQDKNHDTEVHENA